jgi:hypothetical protein
MALWMRRTATGKMGTDKYDLDASPCPAVMAEGIGGAIARSITSRTTGGRP